MNICKKSLIDANFIESPNRKVKEKFVINFFEKNDRSKKSNTRLIPKKMHHCFLRMLLCNKNSNTDCVPFHGNVNLCKITRLKLTSTRQIQFMWSSFFVIDDNTRTMLTRQMIDGRCKSDLTSDRRRLRPNQHYYKQLEHQIISLITDNRISMPTMLDRCYQHYQDYPTKLAAIRNFAQQYRPADAACWFTKDTFVYQFVNKILRSGDIELFHNLRFYIAHLSAQLVELKQKQIDFMKGVNVVYRGLRQSTQELEELRRLANSYIVIKSFMSTSRNRQVALFFAGADQPRSDISQPLLLELTIDFSSPSVIAADISHLSSFPDEREILFDIGTEFRVGTLTFDSLNGIWLCQLFASSNVSSMEYRSPTAKSTEIFPLISDTYTDKKALMNEQIRYDRYRNFDSYTTRSKQNDFCCTLPTLSWIANGPVDLARIRLQQGLRSWQQGYFHKAKSYIENAATLYEEEVVDQAEFAACLAFLGFMFYKTGEFTQAIDFAERSIAISLRLASTEHLILARYYRILGLAYWSAKRVADAVIWHNQALVHDENVRSTAKWSMVLTLRNLALIHRSRGDTVQAAECCMKALTIFREVSELLESC